IALAASSTRAGRNRGCRLAGTPPAPARWCTRHRMNGDTAARCEPPELHRSLPSECVRHPLDGVDRG
ncbi:MAG: hypothetical protein KIS79_14205, partial [Burkholderiales bacterium]|nr:hypothetical protein [Burkholderiales bacterium]